LYVILFGAPGSGKGTQAARLSERLGVPHISTGDMLREAVDSVAPQGEKAKEYIDAGELVPDDVIIEMIADRLAENDAADGAIFDGFPRTIVQAEELARLLDENGRTLDRVVALRVPREVLVSRMLGRGRSDDTEAVVQTRLDVYVKHTLPLEDYYRKRGLLVEVDGTGKVAQIVERIARAIEHGR
jgi:adenylate kinase